MVTVTQMLDALDAKPTLVLSVCTAAYAATSDETASIRAGVRNTDDWLVELQYCTESDAHKLADEVGSHNVHYLLDDGSCSLLEFWGAIEVLPKRLTCSLEDAIDFLQSARNSNGAGAFDVTIDGASWRVVS